MKNNLAKSFEITDYYIFIILGLYSILSIIFFSAIDNYIFLLSENLLIAILIIILTFYTAKYPKNKKLLLLKRILLAPIVFLIYSQVQAYISVVNPKIYDNLLIQADKFIFGANPTELLSYISFPALTEYLQFAYMTYFLMPIFQGVELHNRGDNAKFNYFMGLIIFAFYLSYILYFFFPAIGPRFTIHEFSMLSNELPGLFFADTFREWVNFGGGILNSVQNPAMIVNRDCMPSGHTLITTINIIVSFKLKSKYRWIFLILGASLIFSTVYLRYHYAIDVIASLLLVPLVLWIEPKINQILTKRTKKKA